MKHLSCLEFPSRTLLPIAFALCLGAAGVEAQTHNVAAWVNDPFTPNPNWTLTDANTTSPIYTHTGAVFNGNLFGNSPFGTTITLNNPGDTAIATGQVSLTGPVNTAGNVQFRIGLFHKGSNPADTGWAGYMIGNPTGGGGGGLYLRSIPNTGLYGSGTGTTQPGLVGTSFAAGWGEGTYDFFISVTRLSATSTLVRWKLQGLDPSTYLFAGRYTNTQATTQGGFSFDQVGFLSGGSTWTAAGGVFTFSNVAVTLGQFSDGSWVADADGTWSVTNNWAGGLAANGAGFIADFTGVNLTADRTVTLDSSRSIGQLRFGSPAGLNNWNLNASGGSILRLNTGITSPAGAPVLAVNQNSVTINAPLVSSNGLTKTGGGTALLRGNNTIIGALNLNGGVLDFASLANLPLAVETTTAVNFGGGTLRWGSGNTFDLSGPGIPINFNGTAGIDVGANNVTFANGFGNGGTGGFIKLGAGTLTLNSAVSYTGSTIVSNGVLSLGAAGSIGSSTNIVVGAGATFNVSAVAGGLTLGFGQQLGGSGTVVGSVADGFGSIIAPGTGAGTLTVNGGLALNGGGTLNFELSDTTVAGGGVNDLIAVTGNLNIAGSTTLNVNLLAGAPGLGTYTLFTYNTFSGAVENLVAPPGFVITNNTTAKTIGLIVAHVPAVLTWDGDGSGNAWDVGITPNWIQSGTNQVFFTGDAVTFDNSGSANPPVNIAGLVSPGSVTVNSSQDYTFITGNSGGIATGRLTKSGTGVLTLETDNSYTGPTVINAGTLQVGGPNLGGANGTLGSGPTTNNATLLFNRSSDYTYTNVISGAGNITNLGGSGAITLSGNVSGGVVSIAGAGTLVLSGSNSYTGATIISAGSLNPRNPNALGTTAAGTIIENGARMYLDANIDFNGEAVSVAGGGPDSAGALRKGGNGVTTWSGAVSLTADSVIGVDGGATLNLTHANGISGNGFSLTLAGGGNGTVAGPINLGIGSLTKNDGGTWTVAATNTYTGKTFINGGTLAIPALSALGGIAAFAPDFVTLNGGSLGVTTNLAFADGLRGFTVSGAAGGFNVGSGFSLVISNDITGSGTLTKSGAGTLILAGPNTFTGILNVDTAANGASDGSLRVAHPGAISGVQSPIAIRNTLGGSSTLELDGTRGNITVSQEITIAGRSPAIPAIQSVTGNNTLAGNLTLNPGGTRYVIQSDAGLLTLAGNVTATTDDAQVITFQGSGDISLTGIIADGLNPMGVAKQGSGTLNVMSANTYTGATTVSGGALGGSGTIAGPVTISAGGTLSPGVGIGTLTINNSLTLSGNAFVEVNKSTGTRDQVVGVTSIAYGGSLTVSNVSGTLAPGDSFQIFPAVSFTGNFSSVTGGGVNWNFNPTNGTLTVIGGGLPTTPTNITFSVSGGNMTLSWPASYTGWILQAQTNTLAAGLSTNWSDLPGSASVNSIMVPVNASNGAVFFRMRRP
ncbi:MAG TPA: autotransporter-associated beta strand repeat-containing protein [Verrucomicrobiae bacterium]|nr:autotransporter-associated beta strand repeat-containing protein [Verrucomicrobiae bacterium]